VRPITGHGRSPAFLLNVFVFLHPSAPPRRYSRFYVFRPNALCRATTDRVLDFRSVSSPISRLRSNASRAHCLPTACNYVRRRNRHVYRRTVYWPPERLFPVFEFPFVSPNVQTLSSRNAYAQFDDERARNIYSYVAPSGLANGDRQQKTLRIICRTDVPRFSLKTTIGA